MKNNKSDILTAILTTTTVLVFMLMLYFVKLGSISNKYPLYTGIFIVLMLFIITSAYLKQKNHFTKKGRKKTNHKQKYNIILLAVWIITGLFMLYSDIIVFKKYWLFSLILLLLFTPLFMIFKRFSTDYRDKLWHWYTAGIEIAFVIAAVMCFLFRPQMEGYRYCGLTINPNVFARFLLSVWICLLFRINENVHKVADMKKYNRIGIEGGMVLFFMYATGSRTSFLAVAVISFIWFIVLVYYSRKNNKIFLRHLILAIAISIPSFAMSHIALNTIPDIVNRPITYENDKLFVSNNDNCTICYAAGTDHIDNTIPSSAQAGVSAIDRITSIFDDNTTLDTILNGRLEIYKHYIEDIDYEGHIKYSKKFNHKRVPHAHNSWIQVAYTYGLLAGIAYTLLTILAFIYSIRYLIKFNNKRSTAVLPLLIVIAFGITSLTECLILPIQSLLAFSFYFTVGELINSK